MSSRFVSGGTIAGDAPSASIPATALPPLAPTTSSTSAHPSSTTPHTTANPSAPILNATTTSTTTSPPTNPTSSARANNAEWEAAQASLAREREQRAEARRRAVEGDGSGGSGEKSLYDILQANKAAKQAAFEEASRLRNQFRALDDDEIDFLDGVEEKRRAEEERLRRETEEGLLEFRRAQKTGGGAGTVGDEEGNGDGDKQDVEWNAVGGRKRKREKEAGRGFVKGVIKRRTSEGVQEKEIQPTKEEASNNMKKSDDVAKDNGDIKTQQQAAPPEQNNIETKPVAQTKTASAKPNLGLGDYGSDDDDDD